MEIRRLKDISSTNDYLLDFASTAEGKDWDGIVVADYQSAGKGMGTNTWESEAGKNLLFSILVHPVWLPISEQYLLSMAEALAIVDAMPLEGAKIKWPNDIYYDDRKISGTRIDVNLQGGVLKDMVIGTGININQRAFYSDAPNPVSLYQLAGREFSWDEILQTFLVKFEHYYALAQSDADEIVRLYHEHLYRREGYYPYEDVETQERFEAEIKEVALNGLLTLSLKDGSERQYWFKEVKTLQNICENE